MPSSLLVALSLSLAAPPANFPAARHGGGELRYVGGVPVLTVRGTAAEMGGQFGTLAVKNAPDLDGLHKRFLEDSGQDARYPLLSRMATLLGDNVPAAYREELRAAAAAAGRDETLLLFADTIADLSSGMGCSTVVVEPDRSGTGGPLFGRNFDWLPTKGLTEHTLLVVYKPVGKRAFAALTVTPIAGVVSGMNDAGLAVTINEIRRRKSGDKSDFNWKGVPLVFAFRRVMEECGTVAEAETLLRAMPRTTTCCLTVCDKSGGAVFEITPDRVVVRRPENGVGLCTNHFRCDGLCTDTKCWRYDRLAPLQRPGGGKLGVADVFARLDDVQQGEATLQSMVFEPAARVMHLAYGEGPATRLKPVRLDLGKLFE